MAAIAELILKFVFRVALYSVIYGTGYAVIWIVTLGRYPDKWRRQDIQGKEWLITSAGFAFIAGLFICYNNS